MKDKIADKILKMEKDKLMSKPESDRDWELITALDIALKALEERPQGEWVYESKLYGDYGDSVLVNTCSICKTSFMFRGKTHNFCSNCGADMRGGKDNEAR